MSMKPGMSAAALIGVVATSMMLTTSAHALHVRTPACDAAAWWSCDGYLPDPQTGISRPPRTVDISPAYMKYTDPRYNQSMGAAGGGGGGGGGGGSGGGGGR